MEVTINGESRNVPENLTIIELLDEMKIDGKIAIELNHEILPAVSSAITISTPVIRWK